MNETLSTANAWNARRTKEVIRGHKRAEVDPDLLGVPEGEAFVTKHPFNCTGHEETVGGASLTRRGTWPSYSALSSRALQAEAAVM
eukprot:3755341-Lingulodinium_polyedra.AAC.1